MPAPLPRPLPFTGASAGPASTARGLLLGVLVAGSLLVGGCSAFSTGERPVADSTFTRVLTELHLAHTRRSLEGLPPRPNLRDSIFARYDVRPSAFDATLRYYSRRPEALARLYQSVIDTLRARQRAARRPRQDAVDGTSEPTARQRERSP